MPHRIYYSDKYYDANDYEYRCAPPPRRARPRRANHRGLTISGLFCGQACHPAEGHSEEDPEEQAACRDWCGTLRARARRSCRRPAGRKRCRCSQLGGAAICAEWRALGVHQSRGWVHYAVHRPEPHILLMRRPRTDGA